MVSIIIARFLGPLMLISAAAILLNRKGIQKTVEGSAKNPGLVYLAGLITLLSGIAVVQFHNVWTSDWKSIITVLGWLMVFQGTARMLLPDQLAALGAKLIRKDGMLVGSAVVSAALGIVLTLHAF